MSYEEEQDIIPEDLPSEAFMEYTSDLGLDSRPPRTAQATPLPKEDNEPASVAPTTPRSQFDQIIRGFRDDEFEIVDIGADTRPAPIYDQIVALNGGRDPRP